MNRKTQLFYNTNIDTKFITFDNYTESLVGDILVTNAKLYPTRFLCANIENLDKEDFIKNYLENYYENKLAFLRDNAEDNQEIKNMNLLAYLIDAILAYKNQDTPISELETLENLNNSNIFTFVGNIVEMDYNGTYTDIICTIAPSGKQKPVFTCNGTVTNKEYDYNYKSGSTNILYGWKNEYEGNSRIKSYINNRTIKFDNESKYNHYSLIDSFTFADASENVKFNVIIPLFDLQYIDEISNSADLPTDIVLNNEHNIPLGIYFCDDTITLKNDGEYSPNWSLMISMQFSPFPYSYDIVQNFNDSDAIKDAYLTFAQILAKQTTVLDLMNKYNDMIASLKERISILESSMNNVSSVTNIDNITVTMNDIKNVVENKLSEYDDKINELTKLVNAVRLKWTIKEN